MFIREIQVPVSRMRGVGPATANLLDTLGIKTVGDLLSFWPRDWDDRTVRVPFARFAEVPKVNALATVVDHEWFGFGRMKTLKLIVEDEDGTRAELVCFNRPFLEKSFPVGTAVSVHGSFQVKYGNLQSSSFDIDRAGEEPARVLPVYPLTAGLTQTQLRKIIAHAIADYGRGIDSELPEKVRAERKIPSKLELVHLMHEPPSLAEAERAKQALIFEELFLFEYAIGQRSLERRGKLPDLASDAASGNKGPAREPIPLSQLQARLLERLPFPLTADQLAVIDDLNRDIDGDRVMARLLQGDVGSGKTLVAFFACLRIIDAGGQCAILAPTELLARQHAENAARLLEPTGVRLAFLTGNVKASGRSRLLAELEAGSIDLVIGTHALFSSGVRYKELRLAIIDEQHRFGVLQRSAIVAKGTEGKTDAKPPHLLMMSATPIPRTLALSVFGDLDVSVIRTMPPGRKPVITHLARQGNEAKVYDFIHNELAAGRQAYFVYPLIDQSDTLSLKSAEAMFVELKDRVFPGVPLALIHSKVPEDEQRSIMTSFREGSVRILVATSVVEVGVDVANATCMVIEHAERFGLSALHQLRGRVGRSELQSYCFLVYSGNLTEDGKARLKVMHETTDGFAIAEEDLKLRGPGDVAGIEQSGYLSFDLADPVRDYDVLVAAREAAFAFLLEQ
jgi:ATP-dependent DNA helicase RecG